MKKIGGAPANARIDVDYTSGKPKVKFSYPKFPANKKDRKKGKKWSTVEKDAVSQNAIGTHTTILFFIFVMFGILLYVNYYEYGDYPNNCTVELDEYHYRINTTLINFETDNSSVISKDYDSVNGADFHCDTGEYHVRFDPMDDTFGITPPGFYFSNPEGVSTQLWKIVRVFILATVFLVVFSFINKQITKLLVKNPRYQKWLPEHNAKQKSKKYWKFTKKDFDPETSPFVEIPNFKNVSIEYKCDGDFSKCLKKIKIREHKYYKYDTKKEKVGKLKVEVSKWMARFYFDKIPKDGYMEVIYY